MDGWSEQWERVQIGLNRIERIYAGGVDSSAEARYDMHSFFLNAYHLKDWLADPLAKVAKREVERLVKDSTELSICADLANRMKHFALTSKHPKIDNNTDVASQSVNVDVGRGVVCHSWTIEGGAQSYDALDLANKVRDVWEQFLRSKGLI